MKNHNKKHSPSVDPIEAEFIAALARLRDGTPRNPKLASLAENGKLKINISNVALEAGRSRTLIGFSGCRFQSVRDEILGGEKQIDKMATPESIISRLKEENENLADALRLSLSTQAALAIQVGQLSDRLQETLKAAAKPRVVSPNFKR